MKQSRSSLNVWSTGLRAGASRLVFMFCGVGLFLMVDTLHGLGTGTLDRVSDWYPAGTNLVVTATPALHRYVEWRGDTNDATIAQDTFRFDVDRSRQVEAVFKDHVTEYRGVPWWWLAGLDPAWTTNDFEGVVYSNAVAGGTTVWEAYWSGTDPMNADARFEIGQVQIGAGQIRLLWQHARVDPNLPPVMLQVRTNLLHGDWVDVEAIYPQEGENTWIGVQATNLFYRLQVVLPDS